MTFKQKIYATLGILVILGLVFEAGRYSKPAKVEIQTKEVIKTVIQKDVTKDEKKNKVVHIIETVKSDGTKTTDTTITDKGEIDTHTVVDVSKDTTKSSDTIITRDVGLTIQAFATANMSDLSGNRDYGLSVSKRTFGNLRIGVMADTGKKVGITLGLDF
jgi:hypothetical protein